MSNLYLPVSHNKDLLISIKKHTNFIEYSLLDLDDVSRTGTVCPMSYVNEPERRSGSFQCNYFKHWTF